MDDKPTEIITPMAPPKLFENLLLCAAELDGMNLYYSDHPKLRNLMKEQLFNFEETAEADMPNDELWKKIFFRGTLIVSGKRPGQLPERERVNRSLLVTFWNDHRVTAVPLNEKENNFFSFKKWRETSYADFIRVLEIYLKEEKCFKKKAA